MRIAELTVAIATLDRPGSLARCLEAVLKGQALPAEIIVVDQSRDDATRSLIEEPKQGDVPIIYVRQKLHGLSASRNAAIGRASHPVVVFTDDDCVPDGGWVAAIDRAFAQSPAPDAVAGSVLALGPETSGTYMVSPREGRTHAGFIGKVIPWLIGTGGNFAIKREWFGRVGRYDERLGAGSPGKAAEDADLIYRLLRAGAFIRYEPDAIVYHERQSRAHRLMSRWSYGHGIGAFCGIWLRRGDIYAIRILGYWLFSLGRELAGIVARRKWLEAYQRVLSLQGTVRGLMYGLLSG
jgi:GT2 family glycosyltransferase